MGEALTKANRRDIRRAYAPEASQEVLKFVDGVRQEIALKHAEHHNVHLALKEVDRSLIHRLTVLEQHSARQQHAPSRHTFGQRLRWLWSGTWQ